VWWRQFPGIESRRCVPQAPSDRPDPRFPTGTMVRLIARPGRVRRVLHSEWHWHRQQFVFVVETSARHFKPYWFAGQLAVADTSAEPGAAGG
jgi:hypothetical protein